MEEQEVKQEKKSLEQEERRRKRHLIIIIFLLFISILGLAIAFTKITGELGEIIKPPDEPVIPISPKWDVGFVAKEEKGIAHGSNTYNTKCGSITITATSASISDVTLPTNNNRCSYPLIIENAGTLDAKVSEIVLTEPTGVKCKNEGSSMTCGNIRYKITTDENGNHLLEKGTELLIDSKVFAYLVVETVAFNQEFKEIKQSGAKLTLIYSQA